MNRPSPSSRRRAFSLAWMLVPGCATIAAAAWFVSSSSALSAVANLNVSPDPTHAPFHGSVEIAKPTYTATVTSTPSIIQTETPTEITEPAAQAEVEVVAEPYDTEYAELLIDQEEQASSMYGGNKYILIDISDQYMYAYEGDLQVFNFVASTGMNNSTSVGNFSVLNKIPSAYGATWNIWMPNWLGIYWAGSLQNGIHALPILPNGSQLWDGYLGTPISYGCVVIGSYESQMLYDWAEIGTPVDIQW